MKKRVVLISGVAFLLSWALPALKFEYVGYPKQFIWSGATCFIYGILFGWIVAHIEAIAVIFYLFALGLFLKENWRIAIVLSSIALALACETFLLFYFPVYISDGDNKPVRLIELESGFYFWIGSFMLILMASFYFKRRAK